ncbi:ATP-binding cassette domain-containing protein [Marinicauda pacifica]|uniref:ATP-binding cassette domain-containing protein n=1 Tax=Marinicauda pacifica TaxID=1133559 RepID=UPI0035C86A9B
MTQSATPAVLIEDLRFAYARKSPPVLDIAQFRVDPGERVFLRGASGSGKSTLLGVIAGILDVSHGRVEALGTDMAHADAATRDQTRAERLGVIFQMFNLLPYLPVGENVMLPCRFSAGRARATKVNGGPAADARRLLSRLELDPAEYWNAASRSLSVGQQQRVAAARALIGQPSLILADEPTSALDTDRRDRFIALLLEECASSGAALLFVSHDGGLASHFDRALDLSEINRAGRGDTA